MNLHLQRIDQRLRTQIREQQVESSALLGRNIQNPFQDTIKAAVGTDTMEQLRPVIPLGTKLIGKSSRGARQVRLGHLREAINGNRQAGLNGQNLPNGIHQKEKDLKIQKGKVGPKETKGHTKDQNKKQTGYTSHLQRLSSTARFQREESPKRMITTSEACVFSFSVSPTTSSTASVVVVCDQFAP